MNQFIEGFLLQASLILALGAQNLFVLETGLKKQRNFLVALICSICDTILIGVGIIGSTTLFVQIPSLKVIFGILGVLFLFYYGVKKVIEGFANIDNTQIKIQTDITLKQTVLLTLSFSLLNPHVYLDTIILIGGYAAKFLSLEDKIQFGAGVASFSTVWFFGLSLFAYSLSELLKNPKTLKIISLISGTVLLVLSWKLGFDVYQWIMI